MSEKSMETKCAYCGKIFKKKHFNEKYCSIECRKNSRQEQNRRNFHRWYHKHKNDMGYDKRWKMGTGELGPHMHDNVDKERNAIKNEFARLRLRKWR